MRILLTVLAIAVAVYVVVRLLERGRSRDVAPTQRPPEAGSPRAAAEFRRQVRERAEQQRNGTPPPPAPEPEIHFEDGVFGIEPDGEHFVVVSPAPTDAVVEAVDRACERFMLVDENGVEHPSWDALEAASHARDGDDLYTPNYTAPVKVTPAGVEGYVDCKGGIEPPMGERMRHVLREELLSLRAPARVHLRHTD